MIDVSIVNFDDLTEEEKKDQPDNGCGKEYSTYLKVVIGGKPTAIYSDAMEPEDCIFSRDLYWIISAIEDAYAEGKRACKGGI